MTVFVSDFPYDDIIDCWENLFSHEMQKLYNLRGGYYGNENQKGCELETTSYKTLFEAVEIILLLHCSSVCITGIMWILIICSHEAPSPANKQYF